MRQANDVVIMLANDSQFWWSIDASHGREDSGVNVREIAVIAIKAAVYYHVF